MYSLNWRKHIVSISFILGVIIVGYLSIVGAFDLPKTSLPDSFRPGYYTLNMSFQGSGQRSLVIITADKTHLQGTISLVGIDNNNHGSWWVEDGWLDASLQVPIVHKEHETLLIHFILEFTSHGSLVGHGRNTTIASLGTIYGSPIIETASVSAYQFSGYFLHT